MTGGMNRRSLLARAGAVGAGAAVLGSVDALFAGNAAAAAIAEPGGWGPLVPDPAGLLDLPAGFSYTVISREGDDLRSGQGKVPSRHDGMAAFPGHRRGVTLVRNHECRPDAPIGVPPLPDFTYDPAAKGGCTALELDHSRALVSEQVVIAGTAVNCAGGPTPWRTWLTCEESEDKAGKNGYTRDHGFVFEVDPHNMTRNRNPQPLKAMGRFQHEAVAIDPGTGIVYETEDAFEKPFGLYYRFLPTKPRGKWRSLLAGGELQAMRVPGVPDLSVVQEPGTHFEGIEWVPVPDPLAQETPIRLQDFGPGGITHAQKLEGNYWGNNGVYFVSSFARAAEGSAAEHNGQVWHYNPKLNTLTLEIVFGPKIDPELPGESPDNIALSPHGGLFVCEDGSGGQHVYGVDRKGQVHPLARNRQNTGSAEEPEFGEFAGVTFSPDARTLFVNVYNPGTTFAITGPW
ncbi:alkaline phosphatase PhoX [Pseudonocardia sp. TRM90224]|uniref:alkaline phosphatase PhoX n=1 Tax=Pseudonocardia sp. TRM90224 TaxID=2812678 RepID=UPI001E4F8585|nr:alkaline phosphatase PhoX [Pseudonocardia sp. TRM90224]